MKISDLNAPTPAETAGRPVAAVVPLKMAPEAQPDSRAQVEIALLKARIEHLELVVEAARGLMTANQERLLRRLHEVPRELAALTARLGRIPGSGDAGEVPWYATGTAQGGQS